MSENGHHDAPESESLEAARNAPPLPEDRGKGRVRAGAGLGFGSSALAAALPLAVSVIGAVASGAASRGLTNGRQRDDGDPGDDRDGWLDAGLGRLSDLGTLAGGASMLTGGAKAAGVAGLLKAIGSGKLSSGAATAAKAVALKKLAGYVADLAGEASSAAAKHPVTTAGAASAAYRARSAAQAGYGRARDAATVLRHGRAAVAAKPSLLSSLSTGLIVLGLGAAAVYLFSAYRQPSRKANAGGDAEG